MGGGGGVVSDGVADAGFDGHGGGREVDDVLSFADACEEELPFSFARGDGGAAEGGGDAGVFVVGLGEGCDIELGILAVGLFDEDGSGLAEAGVDECVEALQEAYVLIGDLGAHDASGFDLGDDRKGGGRGLDLSGELE